MSCPIAPARYIAMSVVPSPQFCSRSCLPWTRYYGSCLPCGVDRACLGIASLVVPSAQVSSRLPHLPSIRFLGSCLPRGVNRTYLVAPVVPARPQRSHLPGCVDRACLKISIVGRAFRPSVMISRTCRRLQILGVVPALKGAD